MKIDKSFRENLERVERFRQLIPLLLYLKELEEKEIK